MLAAKEQKLHSPVSIFSSSSFFLQFCVCVLCVCFYIVFSLAFYKKLVRLQRMFYLTRKTEEKKWKTGPKKHLQFARYERARYEHARSDGFAPVQAAAAKKIGLVKLLSFILIRLNIHIDGEHAGNVLTVFVLKQEAACPEASIPCFRALSFAQFLFFFFFICHFDLHI